MFSLIGSSNCFSTEHVLVFGAVRSALNIKQFTSDSIRTLNEIPDRRGLTSP